VSKKKRLGQNGAILWPDAIYSLSATYKRAKGKEI
jgi:hypothetical protein